MTLARKGIFGGTFNPVHWGHLLIAETALTQFDLEQIIWVPTYCPPHKSTNLLAFEHRLEMVRLAIADHPAFIVSDVELHQGGVSYAISTFYQLAALYSNTHWHWLIGMDAFQSLPNWRNSAELAAHCIWLVAPRHGPKSAETVGQACHHVATRLANDSLQLQWSILQMPPIGISSSLIREYYHQGRSLRYLLPEPVRHYLITHQLFS